MLSDIGGLVAPILSLVPAVTGAGTRPLGHLRTDPGLVEELSGLPALTEFSVRGDAGTAVVSTLAEAAHGAVELLGLTGELDELADEAVSAVSRAADDILTLASGCLRKVSTAIAAAPVSLLTGGTVAAIAWDHLGRATHRLTVLESELDALASRVRVVDAAVPAAPADPTTTAPVSSLPAVPTNEAVNRTTGVPQDGTTGAPTPQAAAAVTAARSALGTPYSWGGTQPGVGVDCSGLTQWAYSQAGVDIPRTASAQAVGPQVSADQLAPGDLAVWDGHVAMIAGDGMMIEAGDPVQLSPVRTENIGMSFHGFYRPTG